MENCNNLITYVNWFATIVSCIGAFMAVKYYRKSRLLTIYANTNIVFIEIEKMLNKLTDALAATNRSAQIRRGVNLKYTIYEIGKDLSSSYNTIRKNIPMTYSKKLFQLENYASFNLQDYINSYVSGTALQEDNTLDSMHFVMCQEQLKRMQEYLKQKIVETEERLK